MVRVQPGELKASLQDDPRSAPPRGGAFLSVGQVGSDLLTFVFDVRGQVHPRMPARLPDGPRGCRESRIRERADGNGNHLRRARNLVEDRRAAIGAETEDPYITVVGDTDVLAVPAIRSYPLRVEPGLDGECASRPALTGKAVTDRDANRFTLREHTKLLTATSGVARGQRSLRYDGRLGGQRHPETIRSVSAGIPVASLPSPRL